jgi:hypothetical protein
MLVAFELQHHEERVAVVLIVIDNEDSWPGCWEFQAPLSVVSLTGGRRRHDASMPDDKA